MDSQPRSFDGGDLGSAALFPVLYDELRRLAACQLARSGGGLTLSATTLLHEAYLDMSRRVGPGAPAFPDRGRFLAYSAKVMRTLIIDYVRRRQAQKRGGQFEITSLDGDHGRASEEGTDVERVGEALDELASFEPELAQLVDLKFFCGFSLLEIAELRGVNERTVRRHWDRARLFLHRSLTGGAV